jgi:quercetin dioxygenase-like cupin family protein/predicted ester cyclase
MGTASKAQTAKAPSARSAQEVEALIRSLYDGFNDRQLERGIDAIAADCEWSDMATGTKLYGPKGYLEYNKGWLAAFSDGRIEILNVVVSGDLASVEFVGRGTHDGPFPGPNGEMLAPTQKKVELRLMDMFQLRGDKITRGRTYYDLSSLYRQLAPTPERPPTEGIVSQKGEGSALWMLDSLYEIKVTGKASGGALAAVEVTIPVGKGPPPHTHPGEETVYVLEGRFRYSIGGKTYEGGPGALFHIPRGTLENFEPLETVRALILYTPACGMDEFFTECAEPAQRRELPPSSDTPPDVERMVRIGAKYGLVIKPPQ